MEPDDDLAAALAATRTTWLVTGAAGFVGSHLVEALLAGGQSVRGLDDFSTGTRANLEAVAAAVGESAWRRFELVEGDVRDPLACRAACRDVELVLHQAALGSVPRSLADPVTTHDVNAGGFVRLVEAARAAGCRRLVHASSSSVYGDDETLPRREDVVGRPLSPYAASKRACELWGAAVRRAYGLPVVGLRYFNVFGPRQSAAGSYAAVIPRWIDALARGERATIHGDGETSRDFCPVAVVVEANLRAALVEPEPPDVLNVGSGRATSLRELFGLLCDGLARRGALRGPDTAVFDAERPGDVRHSLADTRRARAALGLRAGVGFAAGLEALLDAALTSLSGSRPGRS